MAYIKNTWNTGDTITADLMNHIEDGVYNNSTNLDNKEDTTNKVTEITSESTDTQYPSANAVYNAIEGGSGGGGVKVYTIRINVTEWEDWDMPRLGTIHTDIPNVDSYETLYTAIESLIRSEEPCLIRVKATYEDYCLNIMSYPYYSIESGSSNGTRVTVGTDEEFGKMYIDGYNNFELISHYGPYSDYTQSWSSNEFTFV